MILRLRRMYSNLLHAFMLKTVSEIFLLMNGENILIFRTALKDATLEHNVLEIVLYFSIYSL